MAEDGSEEIMFICKWPGDLSETSPMSQNTDGHGVCCLGKAMSTFGFYNIEKLCI